MGLALNELVAIKYLSRWDVQKMSSKVGYKIVMLPGEELLAILENTRTEKREVAAVLPDLAAVDPEITKLTATEHEAVEVLKQHGIIPTKALKLVGTFGAESVIETVEYLAAQIVDGNRRSVNNPAGLIIYSLENALPVPANFMSSRKRKAAEEAQSKRRLKDQKLMQEQAAYAQWLDEQQNRAMMEHYSEQELDVKLRELASALAHRDERVRRMSEKVRRDVAFRLLQKELAAEIQIPTFEEWRNTSEQTRLF
jgi:hypothetical protein